VSGKKLHSLAPVCLSDTSWLLTVVSDYSLPQHSRVLPWTVTCLGDRLFVVASLRVWNMLPALLHSADSYVCSRCWMKGNSFD